MNPSAAPANTATSLRTIETCARIDENNIQDGDEDGVDQLLVDITAHGVPSTSPIIGYAYDLPFPDTHVRIVAKNTLNRNIIASRGLGLPRD